MTPAAQSWIAIAIVAAALAYLARHWVRRARRLFSRSLSSDGCGGCGTGCSADAPAKTPAAKPADFVRFDGRDTK